LHEVELENAFIQKTLAPTSEPTVIAVFIAF
jgi:hypothetical protein